MITKFEHVASAAIVFQFDANDAKRPKALSFPSNMMISTIDGPIYTRDRIST